MFDNEVKTTRPDTKTTEWVVKVDKVIKTKNDSLLMVNLDVNGVLIKGCYFKEVTVKKDGQKYKAGDKCYMLDFPSQKHGDKYYPVVWFPVSNDIIECVKAQIMEDLNEQK